MAKDKKAKITHQHPVKLGDGYLCPHCKSQVPVKQNCPACKLEIDWTKI